MLAATQAVAGCPGEDDVWADQCFEAAGAGERLKRAYLKKVKFDKSGHAVLTREPMEMAAIDRQGVIKVPAIYFVGDFDFKDAEAGIGRFGAPRCGYFNVKTYQIVIPPTYDQCQAFRNGEAVVCNDCIRYCTEPECQNSVLSGERIQALDANNRETRPAWRTTLDDICKQGVSEERRINRSSLYVRCNTGHTDPFRKLQ
jgi:hypothetical protein